MFRRTRVFAETSMICDNAVHFTGTTSCCVCMDKCELPNVPPCLEKLIEKTRDSEALVWDFTGKHFTLSSSLYQSTFDGSHKQIQFKQVLTPMISSSADTFLPTHITIDRPIMVTPDPVAAYSFFDQILGRDLANAGAIEKAEAIKNAELINGVSLQQSLKFTYESGVAPILVSALDVSLLRWDNQTLYAKLWYYALGQSILDNHASEALAADPPPWNNPPTHINLVGVDAVTQAKFLVDQIRESNIILCQNISFFENEMSILYTLAAEGNRLNSADGQPQFPWQTVRWPAIPIVCVHTVGDTVLAPVNARPDPETIRQCIFHLANSRDEFDDCVRGLYFAFDLISSNVVVYHTTPLDMGTVNVMVTPWHECYGHLQSPRPQDFNVLMRQLVREKYPIFGLRTIDIEKVKKRPIMMGLDNITNLYRAGICLGALTSAFCTTFFYSFQLTGASVQNWVVCLENNSERTNLLMNKMFYHYSSEKELAIIHRSVLKLLADCCGFSRPADELVHRTWGCQPVMLPGVYDPGADGLAVATNWPYTWGNPLSVSRFLIKRPREWGICDKEPTCSFVSQLRFHGPPAYCGWRSVEQLYIETACSDHPYFVVTCGVYALNIICQYFNWQEAPVLSQQTAPAGYDDPRYVNFGEVEVLPDPQPPYDAASHTFQPCTIMSYSGRTDTVNAVCLTGPNAVSGGINVLYPLIYLRHEVPVKTAGLTSYHH